MAENLPVREHGFMIKGKNGMCWGRPSRGSGGWALYLTRRNAEAAAAGYSGATVVEVTLTIEERIP